VGNPTTTAGTARKYQKFIKQNLRGFFVILTAWHIVLAFPLPTLISKLVWYS